MSNPKRHHFVPQSYLAGFAEKSNFLNVYSKRSGLWRRQKPKQVMVRNRYYHQHWAPDGIDKNILEIGLGQQLEPKGLASLRKLTSSVPITDDDIANILTYIEFQRLRVPRQAEFANQIARNAIQRYLTENSETRETLRNNRIVMKDSFRFEFMRELTGKLTPYLSRMVWQIAHSTDDASFISSDSPVTFLNSDFPPPMEPGVALYGTIVLFPIDAQNMLVMAHPEYLEKKKTASESMALDLEIEDGQVEFHRGIQWNQDAVLRHNRIIYQQAQDIIVASSKQIIDSVIGETTHGH